MSSVESHDIRQALRWAEDWHLYNQWYDSSPFIGHVHRVLDKVMECTKDENVAVSAILHDCMNVGTCPCMNLIHDLHGYPITGIIEDLLEDHWIPDEKKPEYKQGLRYLNRLKAPDAKWEVVLISLWSTYDELQTLAGLNTPIDVLIVDYLESFIPVYKSQVSILPTESSVDYLGVVGEMEQFVSVIRSKCL